MNKNGHLILLGIFLLLSGYSCGSASCGGLTFVNESTTESVIVAAGSLSDISFDTFTLAPEGQNKICGNDTDSISGNYEWENADSYDLGSTNSGADLCMYLTTSHTADLDVCI